MKKIHLISLGCPKNFVDSEVMLGFLQQDGWTVENEITESDVLLVNTCGFIQPAVEEAIEEILELVALKERHPPKLLVVTGCLVQRYQEKLMEELPEVDLFVGTEGVPAIARLIDDRLTGKIQRSIHILPPFLMDSTMPRQLATPFFRSLLKITEGCNNHCAYCKIPSIRGELRSRSIPDLVRETISLEAIGVKELTLIAQDLTAFGAESGEKNGLLELLTALVDKSSIPWIRLMYLYPTGISDALLHLMAANPRIVPYLDIPFQHVSDIILKRMNRRYRRDDLYRLIERVRRILPDIALRTTFLLGFPGETEKDILMLEDFLQDVKIDHVGVFAYANEEGCPAEFFPDQCPEEEKSDRVEHILSLQAGISQKILKKYIGRLEPVLVEGLSKETDLLLEGRTRFQAPDIDGQVYINDGQANPGDIVYVRVENAQVYDLVGGIETTEEGRLAP
ncbi:MAG: 30S ribosomal protein S12 methylthiotransferase RimO [Desulfocapsaceae bacterium]|nr:30S ribosomal protein S12 methylthiotransferase RimO [Desulfocapsaceae bacterium]